MYFANPSVRNPSGREGDLYLAGQTGAPDKIAHGLHQLARFRRDTGALDKAVELYRECLTLLRDRNEPAGELVINTELALTLLDIGQPNPAADHVATAIRLAARFADTPVYTGYAQLGNGVLLHRRGQPEHARAALTDAAASLATLPWAQATALIELGRLLQAAGERDDAMRVLSRAEQIATRIGVARLAHRARAAQVIDGHGP